MNKIYRFTLIVIVLFTACEMRVKRVARLTPAGPGNYRISDFRTYGDIFITGSFGLSASSISCITASYDSRFRVRWFAEYKPADSKFTEGKTLLFIPPGPNGGESGLYVLAHSLDTTGYNNLILIKYDTLGNPLYEKTVERSAGEITAALFTDYGNKIYVVGNAVEIGDSNRIFCRQYFISGELAWSRIHYDPGLRFRGLKWGRYPRSGLLAAGVSDNTRDIFYIRFDSLGEFKALSGYASPELETGLVDVQIGGQGEVVLAAVSVGEKTGKDYLIVEFDPNDKLFWARRYDGPAHKDDIPKTLIVDDQFNIYVTGTSISEKRRILIATLVYDCGGEEVWSARYAAPDDQDAEPYFFNPLPAGTTAIGQHDRPSTTLAGTAGDKALILKYKNPHSVNALLYGVSGRKCRPVGVTSRYLFLNISGGEKREALILEYGPFEVPGISRWD